MADQQRLGDIRQVAIDDRDAQRRSGLALGRRARPAGGRQDLCFPLWRRAGEQRARGAARRAGLDATSPLRRALLNGKSRQPRRGPVVQQLAVRFERLLPPRQRAVLAVERPRVDAREERALQRHAPIALVWCVQVDDARVPSS